MRDATRAALVTGAGLVLAQLTRVFLAGAYTLRGVAGLAVAGVAGAPAGGTASTLRRVGGGARPRRVAAGPPRGTGGAWLSWRPRPGRARCGCFPRRGPGTT